MYIFFSNDLDLDLNLMPLLVCENIPIKMFYTIQYVYFCYGQNDIHSFSTFVNVNMSIFSPNSTLIVLYVI